MKEMKIAILGATSHIAKGLISNFLTNCECYLHLYARSDKKVNLFLKRMGIQLLENVAVYDDFKKLSFYKYDVVINCIGVGTLKHLQGEFFRYFMVCEEYDNLVLNYLIKNCPDAMYLCFSSGAVYGKQFSAPVNEGTENRIAVNHLLPEDYYSIARINSEAKHRAFKNLRIVDLRVFSYFSRFIELTEGYFITDVIDCAMNRKTLETYGGNIVRDYVHPNDLFSIVQKTIKLKNVNRAYDVYSSAPVAKEEILAYFAAKYNLKHKVKNGLAENSATGEKSVYCSINHEAAVIGYMPKYSSLETIALESAHILD